LIEGEKILKESILMGYWWSRGRRERERRLMGKERREERGERGRVEEREGERMGKRMGGRRRKIFLERGGGER